MLAAKGFRKNRPTHKSCIQFLKFIIGNALWKKIYQALWFWLMAPFQSRITDPIPAAKMMKATQKPYI